MATGDRIDPYAQYNFIIEIDGIPRAGFQEISNLAAEKQVIKYREGNELATERKIPGLTEYMNISCKTGMTQDLSLWDWFQTAVVGTPDRKAGAFVLRDEAGQNVLRWTFREGWICKWEGPTFNATANEIAIESIEICHEGMELETA